ncbi:VTC domain protein [Toxoplasma gondii ARI]|uniref:VTC domain protein n=1 Tax=Toxoplasma gondii ARI TaxID=1074872 RepID=A0A139XTH4_TOXGO|nr:VTC domain protein [Toxoplasma gondii ARI]
MEKKQQFFSSRGKAASSTETFVQPRGHRQPTPSFRVRLTVVSVRVRSRSSVRGLQRRRNLLVCVSGHFAQAAALLRQQNLQKSEGGADEEAEEAELAGNSATSAASLKRKIGATQPITSVYVDSNTGYCFENRILRMEGAELIRFRWYGVNDNEGDKPVFVERKTHHESWTGLSSTKERFTLDQKFVKSYLLGRLPAAEALGIQFRERWWRDKKKEEEAKEREEREREGEAEAKEKTERNGRQEDGEACQDSEEGERERERAMEPREEATSREGCRENVGVGAEDERCRARKETTTEQRRQWEREEEEAETKYFQDAKTQKSLQLACEIQNTLLRHSLLPMVRAQIQEQREREADR